MKLILFVFSSIILFSTNLTAQFIKLPSYSMETGTVLSGGKQTPFWLISNQYGLVTPNKSNFWLKTGFHSNIDSSRKIDYDYGFDLVNRYSNKYDIYVHQAYFRIKLWFTAIQGGKIEEKIGNQNPDLSSGGLLWSANARPMTKITFLMPNYTPIPFSKGYLEFKAGVSHGWFDNNEYITNFYLHHKYVYFQIGGKLPVHAHYGFHHYAQWGGTSSDATIGQLPSKFSDFKKVFMGKSGEGSTPTLWEETANRIGNHIGSRNFGFDFQIKKYRIDAYWQTIFEDGSGRAYRNIEDGLWGLSFKILKPNILVNAILIEYINTTNQSGTSQGYYDEQGKFVGLSGNDNYFNHYIYRTGWTYHNMTIGSPLITSPTITHGNASNAMYLINNKLKAWHLGIKGNILSNDYKIVYTYSNNYGTNDNLFSPLKKQNSFYSEVSIKNITKFKLKLALSLAIDFGTLYGNNFGFGFKLIKHGVI